MRPASISSLSAIISTLRRSTRVLAALDFTARLRRLLRAHRTPDALAVVLSCR